MQNGGPENKPAHIAGKTFTYTLQNKGTEVKRDQAGKSPSAALRTAATQRDMGPVKKRG
jgi:hypothetical protein